MTVCITCGDVLHPERAQKYDYCTKPECQERNAEGLTVVAVGVNKAADQYVILNERTKQEMASGRYKKRPEAPGAARVSSGTAPARPAKPASGPTSVPDPIPHSSARDRGSRWSKAQENLAVIYRSMGMKPDQIAKKLGVSEHLVTKILLAAPVPRR